MGIELELNRTIQSTDEVHKTITKGERRVKELLFQQEENKKNHDRITDLVDKLQQKIKSLKKRRKLLPSIFPSTERLSRTTKRPRKGPRYAKQTSQSIAVEEAPQ